MNSKRNITKKVLIITNLTPSSLKEEEPCHQQLYFPNVIKRYHQVVVVLVFQIYLLAMERIAKIAVTAINQTIKIHMKRRSLKDKDMRNMRTKLNYRSLGNNNQRLCRTKQQKLVKRRASLVD